MIKTELNEPPPILPVQEYPYIGKIAVGNVVLFSSRQTGTLLRPATLATHKVGYVSSSWAEIDFVPLNGSITLSNDAP